MAILNIRDIHERTTTAITTKTDSKWARLNHKEKQTLSNNEILRSLTSCQPFARLKQV